MAKQSRTAILTHYGRKSGQAYRVTIWFAAIDGCIWVGSQDRSPNWVRNISARPEIELDFGEGPRPYRLQARLTAANLERFERAILAKYPISGRLIRLLGKLSGRTGGCAFSAEPL